MILKIRLALLIAVISMSVCISQAQIIYTDVNPDVSFGMDQQYLLDVDNDGNNDYIIEQVDSVLFGDTLEGVQLRSVGTQNEAIYETSTLTFLKGLALNDPIDEFQNWTVPSPSLPAGGIITINGNDYPAGDWADGLDHYAGLHFFQGANPYYGWVRFSVTTDGLGFTIKDYAYHVAKDHPLLAGSIVDGVEETENIGIDFFVFNQMLTIRNHSSTKTTAKISDISGKIIFSDIFYNTQSMVDLSSFASGVYVISFENDKGISSDKFYLN